MSSMKGLDLMIQEVAKDNYEATKREINAHIHGEISFEELTETAQEIVKDWESYCHDRAEWATGKLYA